VWAIARGKLWRFYNPELVDKIARQGRMSVSAETNVTKAHRETDREVYSQWYGLGVTILGDGVAPAVPGANIKALEAMQSQFKEMQLRAASYHTDKPQDNNKGVKTLSGMSNVPLLKKVQEKFKDYRILDMSENGDHILMLNASGLPALMPVRPRTTIPLSRSESPMPISPPPSSSRTVLWYPSM